MPVTNRVTNTMLINNFNSRLNQNMTRLSKLQGQLATNKQFQHISDDPIALIYSQEANNRLRRISDFQQNLDIADQWLKQVESSLLEMNDVFKSAYEAVIDASTDVKTSTDRNNMANYIAQLRDQVLDCLNSSTGSKYVFGGYNTTGYQDSSVHPPFEVGDTYSFLRLESTDPDALKGIEFSTFSVSNADLKGETFNAGDWTITQDIDGKDVFSLVVGGQTFQSDPIEDVQGFIDGVPGSYSFTLTDTADPDAQITLSFNINEDFDYTSFQTAIEDVSGAFDTQESNLYYNGVPIDPYADHSGGDVLSLQIGVGINFDITFNGLDVAIFNTDDVGGKNTLYGILDELYNELSRSGNTVPDIQKYISQLQKGQDSLLRAVAQVGGRSQRIEALQSRYELDEINYTEMKSEVEDCDQAEVIMYYKMAEAVYKAALSTGSYIIQNTLMDYLR